MNANRHGLRFGILLATSLSHAAWVSLLSAADPASNGDGRPRNRSRITILYDSAKRPAGPLSRRIAEDYRQTLAERVAVVSRNSVATTWRVLYGTNRRGVDHRRSGRIYGDASADLEFGQCDVSIPDAHQKGRLDRALLPARLLGPNPAKDVLRGEARELRTAKFYTEVGSLVSNRLCETAAVTGASTRRRRK